MVKSLLLLLSCAMLASAVSCNSEHNVVDNTIEGGSEATYNTQDDNTEIHANNATESESNTESKPVVVNPLEKYVGEWDDNFYPPNELDVYYVNDKTLKCNFGIYRLTTFHLIATVDENQIHFVDENNFISGKIEFENNSILLTIEESNFSYIQNGAEYLFTIKEDIPMPKHTAPFEESVVNLENTSQECYSFINQKVGYYFYFVSGPHNQLLSFKKTTDGGKTWHSQPINAIPTIWHQERFICAKMLDENVGFISAGHYADDNVSKRTYISTDGGLNWEQVVLPPDDYYTKGDSGKISTYMWSGEAYDLVYENEQYVLYFRLKGEEPIYFQYSSTDLKTWTYVE